jgi:hypothetical protein
MITLNMMLVPQGIGMFRTGILSGQIWTTDDNQYHDYCIRMDDNAGTLYTGRLPKTYSAHKNPFRILADILDNIDGT